MLSQLSKISLVCIAMLTGLLASLPAFSYRIITPFPAYYQANIVTPPRGFLKCYETQVGLYKNIWTSGHQVCLYPARSDVWVAGYWQCNRYTPSRSVCHSWRWVMPQWSAKDNVQLEPDEMLMRFGQHMAL